MTAMDKAVIIVASGKGLRMGGDIPKQFLPVGGRPILMQTIDRFHEYDPAMQIIVVLHHDWTDYWRELCIQYGFTLPVTVAEGGKERFHSVRNGLALVDDSRTLVGVHDGVRPYVSTEVIARCYDTAAVKGAAIPVIDVYETLRELTPEGSRTVPRSQYKLVQTPQVFQTALLRQAYNQRYNNGFTDDASVVESIGHGIALVEGNRENIKITTRADLKTVN